MKYLSSQSTLSRRSDQRHSVCDWGGGTSPSLDQSRGVKSIRSYQYSRWDKQRWSMHKRRDVHFHENSREQKEQHRNERWKDEQAIGLSLTILFFSTRLSKRKRIRVGRTNTFLLLRKGGDLQLLRLAFIKEKEVEKRERTASDRKPNRRVCWQWQLGAPLELVGEEECFGPLFGPFLWKEKQDIATRHGTVLPSLVSSTWLSLYYRNQDQCRTQRKMRQTPEQSEESCWKSQRFGKKKRRKYIHPLLWCWNACGWKFRATQKREPDQSN